MVDYTETVEFSVVRAVATAGGAPISSTYSAWSTYSTITIANPPAVSDYQVQIPVTFAAGMNADFSDLRFTDIADAALPYWVESSIASTSAIIWVKVAASAASILMYYGNAAATSESAGAAVFDFFDDFSGTSVDTAKWNVLAGASVSGGQLSLSASEGYSAIASKTLFSAPYRAISRVKCTSRATTYIEFGFGVHQSNNTSYAGDGGGSSNGYRVNESDTATHGANIQKFNGSWTTLNQNSFNLAQNTYFRTVLSCLASGNALKLEFQPSGGGANIVSAVSTDTTYTSGYLSLINYGNNGGTTVSICDFIAVGKYSATPPTCSVGTATQNGEQPAAYTTATAAYNSTIEFGRLASPSIGPASFGCAVPFSIVRSPTVGSGSAYSETVEFSIVRAPDPPRTTQLIEFTGVLAGISTVKGSTTDSFWTLNQEIDEAHPLPFEARLGTKIIRQDKAGIEHCVFYGFLPEKSTQLAYCADSTNVVGYDYGEYLSEQMVPAELLVLPATQEPSTWIRAVLGGDSWESVTGVMPYRIHVIETWGTTIPAKEFPFKRDTPIAKAIKDVTDYYGYIFNAKWINLGPVLSVDNPDPSRRLIVIGAADYDAGAGGYSDHEPANLGGAYRPDEGVDVELFPTERGYSVGWIRDGEWLKFTRTFPWTGQYALSFRVACMGEACYFDVSIDGVNLSRVYTGANYLTGDYSVFVNTDPDVDHTIANITAGEHEIRIDFGGNVGEAPNDQHQNLASITCSPIPTGDAMGADHFIPAAYLLGEAELDSITNGLDLPTPRTFTNPSDAILNNVKISQKASNTCNRVVVGGHDAQGVYWWVVRETAAVTHDGELAREKVESPDACTTIALTNTYADNLLAYYQLDQQSYDLSVDQGMDLQPYQLIRFVGYDQIPTGWCRIVSASYHCEYLNDFVDISVVPVATFTAQRRLVRSLLATNTNITESIVNSAISDIPGILVGTVASVNGSAAVVDVESGGAITTRCT